MSSAALARDMRGDCLTDSDVPRPRRKRWTRTAGGTIALGLEAHVLSKDYAEYMVAIR
jgi:hypothetical protein